LNVEIRTDRSIEKTEVVINCRDITKEVLKLKKHIENYSLSISASDEGETVKVVLDDIFYIESVDKRTFIYTKDKVLSTDKRLYELEEILDKKDFFRCSKSVILNINKVIKLKPEISRNILATLINNEVVVVSRRYAHDLKEMIGV